MASGNPNPAPTGCFKCGRPGHWSRDCPSSGTSSSTATPDAFPGTPSKNPSSSAGNWKNSTSSGGAWKSGKTSKPVAPVLPRKRPKLTPNLLLSNDGLGYVLENFPRMVKIKGPGHEVEDLKSLLDAYVHWHSRILPYFSFDQFVEKVEKVGCTKRVRICLHELKEKVLSGGNPKSALNGTDQDCNGDERDPQGNQNLGMERREHEACEEPYENTLPDDIHEDLFDEFYHGAIDEDLIAEKDRACPRAVQSAAGSPKLEVNTTLIDSNNSTPKCMSEDQKARMEANRLKALERAKARAATVLTG